MGCNVIRTPDGGTAILCGRGQKKHSCHACFKQSQFQCDFPVGKTKTGRNKTCSRHLCFDHVKHGITKGVDFCQEHYPIALAAYERRTQK